MIATTPSTTALAEERPAQLVLISFDGAHDNALWERSLKLGDSTGARFTYFLSCTFLMTKDDRKSYKAPGHSAGRSNVGFAQDNTDVLTRLGHIWAANQTGHEIGSHGCGHFDGKDWSKSDWLSEFDQFDSALASAWSSNGAEAPAGWAGFARSGVTGFRAPYLSAGDGLFAALAAHGLSYDASTVSRGPVMPDLSRLTARFALPLIPEGPQGRRIIAMDYNLFVRHSAAFETPSKAQEFEERTLDAFRSAFEAEYTGKRRPLQLGFHFVEMNGGAYWNALERFAAETCGRPEVACVTYQDALRRLERGEGSAS
ncbi:polysaccharide deacetylase [Hoeflea sp.]|uniref:polysaccharide deacetylase n=1 Tax=Hoeflea sp. TaxID=1940281 RepID=UPI0025BCD283|nr:polysaccharide deacetylase [Hoeflea sp.]